MTSKDRDREALERAVARARELDAQLIAAKLASEDWLDAAAFAASLCQDHALRLSPHQLPPCEVAPEQIDGILAADASDTWCDAAMLLRRMLRAGLSRWEPDPIAALRLAERRGEQNGALFRTVTENQSDVHRGR